MQATEVREDIAELASETYRFRFGQLNAFEKILLARKGPAAAASMTRYVRDKWELIPPNPEEFDRLFEVAIKTAALEGGGSDVLAKLGQVQQEGKEMYINES